MTQIDLASRLQLIEKEKAEKILIEIDEIQKMTRALCNKLIVSV